MVPVRLWFRLDGLAWCWRKIPRDSHRHRHRTRPHRRPGRLDRHVVCRPWRRLPPGRAAGRHCLLSCPLAMGQRRWSSTCPTSASATCCPTRARSRHGIRCWRRQSARRRRSPERAYHLRLTSGVPPGASTGTSAAVVVAVLAAFDEMAGVPLSRADLARRAHAVEVRAAGTRVRRAGSDRRRYGGVNFIEMPRYPDDDRRADRAEGGHARRLDARLLLVYLGRAHDSSAVHREVIASIRGRWRSAPDARRPRALARQGREALLAGDLAAYGRALSDNCALQAALHPSLVSDVARRVIEVARGHGAAGWKVNGAGGNGGSVTLLCGPSAGAPADLARQLEAEVPGVRVLPLRRLWRSAACRQPASQPDRPDCPCPPRSDQFPLQYGGFCAGGPSAVLPGIPGTQGDCDASALPSRRARPGSHRRHAVSCPTGASRAAPRAAAGTETRAGACARGAAGLQGAGRRHGLQDRAGAGERSGHGEPDRRRDPAEQRLHQLRRPVPGRARAQRHPDLGPRHQPHQPRRDVDAVDRPAGAGGRPQHLPGLLRLRRLGLSPGEPRRDQADRSDPRPGIRHLGRQRDERRRQRHHQVAARAAGNQRHAWRGHVRPRGVRQQPGQRHVVLRQRVALADRQRSLGVQGLGRRLLAGPAGAPDRQPAKRRAVSDLHQRGDDAAEAERAGRLRLRGRPAQAGVRGRRGRHRRHPAQRHRALRHQLRHRPRLRQGELQQGRDEVEFLHQHPQRGRDQPAGRRARRAAAQLPLREQHLRRRVRRRPDVPGSATS